MNLFTKPLSVAENNATIDAARYGEWLIGLPEWQIALHDSKQTLQRSFRFTSYTDALQFTGNIGVLAAKYRHYPTIVTTFDKVLVLWHTTEGKELTENDFILAAKTSQLISH